MAKLHEKITNYRQLMEAIAPFVLLVEEEGYSGDSWVLFRTWNQYGFLDFGWGAGSGCDALEAADTLEEQNALLSELEAKVIWGTAERVLAHINDAESVGRWYGDSETFKKFRDAATALLK